MRFTSPALTFNLSNEALETLKEMGYPQPSRKPVYTAFFKDGFLPNDIEGLAGAKGKQVVLINISIGRRQMVFGQQVYFIEKIELGK